VNAHTLVAFNDLGVELDGKVTTLENPVGVDVDICVRVVGRELLREDFLDELSALLDVHVGLGLTVGGGSTGMKDSDNWGFPKG
jgi:hypothetical protein